MSWTLSSSPPARATRTDSTLFRSASQGRAVDRPLRLGDRLRIADMEPDSVEPDAHKPAFLGRVEEERREAEDVGRFVLEQIRLDDSDPGIDVRRNLALLAAREPAVGVHREVARP